VKRRPNLPGGLGEIPKKSLRNPTTPTYKKKMTRGRDYDSTTPGRRTRKATRRRNCGRLRVGGGGPDTFAWAAMLSLMWTLPSVSASLRDNEGRNNQEITITGVGAVEQKVELWRNQPHENEAYSTYGAIHNRGVGSIH
jgi:hypothetical protein